MLRVKEVRDLFDAAAALAAGLRAGGDRLAILTNGGGLGVLAADALEEAGGRLAPLSPETLNRLNSVLPPTWSHANPIDIIGDADGARYQQALAVLMPDRAHDALLVMNCPTGVADSMDAARAVVDAHRADGGMPLLTCWMGEATAEAARRRLASAGLSSYETPDDAVRAFMRLVEYSKNQAALLETPQAVAERAPAAPLIAKKIINGVLKSGRSLLTEPEAKALLAAYGVPIVETFIATTPENAAARADMIGKPVALKILSPDITHKSDIGGVKLNLRDGAAVQAAAEAMLSRIRNAAPSARIDGFTVQEMISRPRAKELLLGVSEDPTFGPVLMFGQGGTAVEVVADRAIALAPLNSALARSLIAQTRIAKLLAGYRDVPAANVDAVVGVLLALSDMVSDLAEIVELDINPLLADADGVLALDARVLVRAATAPAQERLAIRPYPAELVQNIQLEDGAVFSLRALKPEDEPALIAFGAATSPEDLRLRFHGQPRELTHEIAARLSQIDYDREMALAAFDPSAAIAGVARLIFDPNFETGEYAILVRSDLQKRGLGRRLMHAPIAYATSRGARELRGDVLSDNANMLTFVRELGGSCTRDDQAPEVTRTRFALTGVT
ncbi:MAG TPA: GNAT family N-acetyltransferase [Caulobacterales bacterium]|nr:GNAT family N-acetyltransferase [Caulobacterales bacterium]